MAMTEKAARGQTIRTETSPNRSSHKVNEKEALMGRGNTGGPNSVAHSLSGAGEVVTYNDKK